MRDLIAGLAAVVVLLTGTGQVRGAAIVNGGFNGNLNGWTQETDTTVPHGDPDVATAILDVRETFSEPGGEVLSPTEGSHFVFLEATSVGTPQGFSLTPYAVLTQTFIADAGDRIVGDYFTWLYKDGARHSSEFSIAISSTPGHNVYHAHSRTWPGEDTIETLYWPWTEFQYTFEEAGTYQLEIYVQATSNAETGSARAFGDVDNIRFEAIPEPSTLALLLMGTVGLLAYAWRKRHRVHSRARRPDSRVRRLSSSCGFGSSGAGRRGCTPTLLLALMIGAVSSASTQTRATAAPTVATWLDAVDGEWDEASKWSTAVYPNNGTPSPSDS